jgi:hypothetical protein
MDDKRQQGQQTPPPLSDYSAEAMRRAVRSESLTHPLVLYPTAVGVLSGLAAMIYNMPLLFLGMGGLLAVGAGTSVVNYFFRSEALTGKYLAQLAEKYRREREERIATLKDDLSVCEKVVGAEQYSRQGREQFERVAMKFRRLNELLQKKFKVGELTYGSFLGAAEQVHLSVLDNLVRMVLLIKSAEAIDPAYISARLSDLKALKKISPADEREYLSLAKRLDLRERQLDQINTLLTENEESMTVIDETIAAVAAVQTGRGLAEVDLQSAMTHLKEIAGRAKLFDNTHN